MPEVPTLLSLGVIVGILALVTTTSLVAKRRRDDAPGAASEADVASPAPEEAATTPVTS